MDFFNIIIHVGVSDIPTLDLFIILFDDLQIFYTSFR